jgi:hypothetical protein
MAPDLAMEPGFIKNTSHFSAVLQSTGHERKFVGVLQSNSRREFRTETLKSGGEYSDEYAL